MSRKITMKLGKYDTVEITIPNRTVLPLVTLRKLVLYRQGGDLVISKQTPIAAGYGRSLRAAILGMHYKVARRIGGSIYSFLPEDFQDPSGGR
jgi:hypothetical protein